MAWSKSDMEAFAKDERRKHSRVGFTTAVFIVSEAGEKPFDLQGNSRDLSLKGLFVSTKKKIPCGAKCSIKVYLNGGVDKIELLMKGTIVRITDTGMGIVFDSMDVDTYSHLKNLVSYNCMDDSAQV